MLKALGWLVSTCTVVFSHTLWAEQAPTVLKAFPPAPAAVELQPQSDFERNAGVVVLTHEIEYASNISSWRVAGKITEQHYTRFWVRDRAGVEQLFQHTFFGDETGVIVADIRGRTISPDGSIHPIDPDKDVQRLDVEQQGEKDDLLRTVNFPRVEPGAVLDLAWTATTERLPGLESVALERSFPTRNLQFKSQGRLIGGGKAFMLGTGNFYWVPFFFSRVPENVHVRMSSLLDLELTASNLKEAKSEPLAPPGLRTSAHLGIIPMSFPYAQWRKNVHLLPDTTQFPEKQKGEDRVWAEGPVASTPLAYIDELGLQRSVSFDQSGMAYYENNLKSISRSYKRFARRPKTAETAADLEKIAPSSLPWSERVDKIFWYARERLVMDPNARYRNKLDKLLKQGRARAFDMLLYTKYLFEQAGMQNHLVTVLSRYGPPFVPLFESWDPFTRILALEVIGPEGQSRYLEPNDYLAGAHSFSDAYLGGIVFRNTDVNQSGWVVDNVELDAPIVDKTVVEYQSELTPSLVSGDDPQVPVSVKATAHGAADNTYRWSMGVAWNPQDSEQIVERRQSFLERWLSSWGQAKPAEDAVQNIADPRKDLDQPYVMDIPATWEPDVQNLGDEVLIPAFPSIFLLQNKLVAQNREQVMWLSGGEFDIAMHWRIPQGKISAFLPAVSRQGPKGMHFDFSQTWDDTTRVLSNRLVLKLPAIVPAEHYAETRAFFEALHDQATASMLVEI